MFKPARPSANTIRNGLKAVAKFENKNELETEIYIAENIELYNKFVEYFNKDNKIEKTQEENEKINLI